MFRKAVLCVAMIGMLSVASESWACGGMARCRFTAPSVSVPSSPSVPMVDPIDAVLNLRKNCMLALAKEAPQGLAKLVSVGGDD